MSRRAVVAAEHAAERSGPILPTVYCGSRYRPWDAHDWFYVCLQEPHGEETLCRAGVGGTVRWKWVPVTAATPAKSDPPKRRRVPRR